MNLQIKQIPRRVSACCGSPMLHIDADQNGQCGECSDNCTTEEYHVPDFAEMAKVFLFVKGIIRNADPTQSGRMSMTENDAVYYEVRINKENEQKNAGWIETRCGTDWQETFAAHLYDGWHETETDIISEIRKCWKNRKV